MVVFDALSSVILKVHFCDHVITCGVYRGFIDLSFEKKVAINKKVDFTIILVSDYLTFTLDAI